MASSYRLYKKVKLNGCFRKCCFIITEMGLPYGFLSFNIAKGLHVGPSYNPN